MHACIYLLTIKIQHKLLHIFALEHLYASRSTTPLSLFLDDRANISCNGISYTLISINHRN